MNKEASELNAKVVADQIADIIKTMISRMSLEGRQKALPNIKKRLNDLNVNDMAQKKSPGGASIGTSISIVKNILNGKDAFFIRMVMKELQKKLVL